MAIKEAAEKLDVSLSTIYAWTNQGRRVGGKRVVLKCKKGYWGYEVTEKNLEKFLKKNRDIKEGSRKVKL